MDGLQLIAQHIAQPEPRRVGSHLAQKVLRVNSTFVPLTWAEGFDNFSCWAKVNIREHRTERESREGVYSTGNGRALRPPPTGPSKKSGTIRAPNKNQLLGCPFKSWGTVRSCLGVAAAEGCFEGAILYRFTLASKQPEL